MKQKLESILIIDDDEATNFINEMVIRQVDCTDKVISKQYAADALEYLTTMVDGKYPRPDLILLDINMPSMNGWEFMEEYKKLDPLKKAKITIIMLTTSLNAEDEEKAKCMDEINGFKSKPLTPEMMSDILSNYFSHLERAGV